MVLKQKLASLLFLLSILASSAWACNICPDNTIKCAPGQTCCPGPDVHGSFMCCPSPSATCCLDGVHCCAQGFECDTRSLKCVRQNSTLSPDGNGDNDDDDIPAWFYSATYCVHWLNPDPTKQFRMDQCEEIFQQTETFDMCPGDHTEYDCYRNINFQFKPPSSAPAWSQAIQIVSNAPDWATSFILRIPSVAPPWLRKIQLCFYR